MTWLGSYYLQCSAEDAPHLLLLHIPSSSVVLVRSTLRWFHANPELSFEEVLTAAKIVEILKGMSWACCVQSSQLNCSFD